MLKEIVTFLFAAIAILNIGCSNAYKKREVNKIGDEVFYYLKKRELPDDSLLVPMSLNMNTVFNLLPIEKSQAQQEIRIYFYSPFVERFFVQNYKSGIVKAELYNCGSRRRGDSLFMILGEVIRLESDYSGKDLVKLDSIPKNMTKLNWDTTDVMDGGSLFLIQAKEDDIVKSILIDNPFDLAEKDINAMSISNFIREIQKKYSFEFWQPWEETVKNGFILNKKED